MVNRSTLALTVRLVALAGLLAWLAPTALADDKGASKPAGSASTAKDGGHDAKPASKAHDHAHNQASQSHADAGHDDHGKHQIHGADPGHYFGPKTSFLHVSLKLFVWTFFLFGVLYAVMRFMAWGPVIAALEGREHRIAQALRDAQAARDEAARLLGVQDQALAEAQAKSKDILDQARAEATREAEALLAKTRDDVTKKQAEATQQIESAKTQALAELRGSAANLSAQMAGQLANRAFSVDDIRVLATESS